MKDPDCQPSHHHFAHGCKKQREIVVMWSLVGEAWEPPGWPRLLSAHGISILPDMTWNLSLVCLDLCSAHKCDALSVFFTFLFFLPRGKQLRLTLLPKWTHCPPWLSQPLLGEPRRTLCVLEPSKSMLEHVKEGPRCLPGQAGP